MNILLDTHVLLWWLDNPKVLSPSARESISNAENGVYVSLATVWEIVIKKSLGKLSIPNDLPDAISTNGFALLPLTLSHILAVESLPLHHRDPFDRVLIAQALNENLTIATRDADIMKYSVPHIPA